MKLLYITYKVDDRDSLVGFVSGWLRGLAAHFEQIEVICLAAGEARLPPNVHIHSLGKERGLGRWQRALNFIKTLWRLRSAVDTVFCQFSPEYVLAVVPLAKLKGWPIALWYTHRQVSWRLRVATRLADRVLTASPESFQLASAKVRVIGHGIDTQRFSPATQLQSNPRIILAVGRRSPIKHYELLIDAIRVLICERGRVNIQVRIVGGDEGNAPPNYANDLQTRINQRGLESIIKLVGPVPYDQVPGEYQQATLHINLCPTGGLDKAVLEGLATGLPTLVRNESFQPLLGEETPPLVIPQVTAHELAEHIDGLLKMPESKLRELALRPRSKLMAGYSQDAFIARLVNALQQL